MISKTTEEFIEMIDEHYRRAGAATLTDMMASVTIPDDLNKETWEAVQKARSSNQRISDYALKCLALHQKGQMTHKRYVEFAQTFHDLEGITPMYLRRLNK